jgi:exopolysaccharide biosynthesis polyprenyl glycosylphosphotransferase
MAVESSLDEPTPLGWRGAAMNSLRRKLLLDAFRIADALVMSFAFAVALVATAEAVGSHNPAEFLSVRVKVSNFLLFFGFMIAWHLIFRLRGLYLSRRIGLLVSEWWAVAKAVALGTLLLAALGLLLKLEAVDRGFLVLFFSVSLAGTILTRSLLRLLLGEVRRRGRNLRNLVIVGCGTRGARLGAEIWNRPELGYLLLGYVDDIEPPRNPLHGAAEKLLGRLGDAERILSEQQVDEVVICLPLRSQYEEISRIISLAAARGLHVRMLADFFELRLINAQVEMLDAIPIVNLTSSGPASWGLMAKRAMDVVLAGAGLLLLAPIFVVVGIAVALDSAGPVFFVQERVGLGRRRFSMWKFRTMVQDAEARVAALEERNEVKGAAFKISHDPRVTRIGRFLRKLSLDELPQLFNVLRGDMSLVGPRPLPVRDVERIAEPWQHRRFSMKPGLTCLWQVSGRHEITFDHWMELDLQYIDRWSPALDLEIVMKTVPAVLRGVGAS